MRRFFWTQLLNFVNMTLSRYPEVGINQSFAGPMKLDDLRNIFYLEATNSSSRIYFEKCVLDYKIGKIWLRENPQNWGTPKTWLRSTMSLIRQGAPSPPFDWTKVDWTKIFQNNGWGATLLALKNLHQKPWEKQGGMGGTKRPKISDEICDRNDTLKSKKRNLHNIAYQSWTSLWKLLCSL